mmetsp:Transcript_2441/g.4119  ORF Transcript_2441/g.4119 Transcript_2441/m.4119 type:complete len:87 (+) Transcript_2441:260-520(+)
MAQRYWMNGLPLVILLACYAGVFLVGKSQDEHMLSVHQNALFSRHRHNVHVDMTALPSPVNNHTDVAVLKATIRTSHFKVGIGFWF